jgi:hypothetical protein
MRRKKCNPRLLTSLLFAACSLLGAAAKQDNAEKTAAQPPPAAAAQPPTPAVPEKPEFAGSETCQACHEEIYNSWAKSPHHIVEITPKRGYKGRGCESCHGMASLHAGSGDATLIRNPAKLTAAAADKICLTCHLNQPTHIGRLQSSHGNNSVSCVACHKIHANGPNGLVVRKPVEINGQCAGCHTNVWASFQKTESPPSARRRDELHRLPQSAWQHSPGDGPVLRVKRSRLLPLSWR